MKGLFAILLLVAGATFAAADGSIRYIYLLNRAGYKYSGGGGNYVGVPLITLNENGTYPHTTVCEGSGFGNNESDFLCRKAGFPDGGTFTTYGDLEEKYQVSRYSSIWAYYPRKMTLTDCPTNATILSKCTYKYNATGVECTIDDTVALYCNPVWELEKVELKRNTSMTTTVSGSYGTVVATMRNTKDGSLKSGMGYYANSHTRDFLCTKAGYPKGAEKWNYNYSNDSDSLAETFIGREYAFPYYLYCPKGTTDLSECRMSYQPFYFLNILWKYGLILYCKKNTLATVSMETGHGFNSTAGTVVVTNQDTLKKGLICGKNLDQHTADLVCRAAGYRFAETISTNYEVNNDDRLDCTYMKENSIQPMLKDIICPRNASSFDSCSTTPLEGITESCDADNALNLACTNEIPASSAWILVDLKLARNPGGGHLPGNVIWDDTFGTVLATLYSREDGSVVTGLVPFGAIRSPYCNTKAMCRSLQGGSDNVEYNSIGEMEERDGKGLSCGYIVSNDINFLPIASMECGCGGEVSVEDCTVIVSQSPQSNPKEALWINC